MTDAERILIADDQPEVLHALRLLFGANGYGTESANSPAAVARLLQEGSFDAVLMDLNYARDTTSGEEGMGLLRRINAVYPTLPVIVMTAWGSVEGAVEAMRHGARDYVGKPWDNERLLATIRTQLELGRALRRAERLEDENTRLKRHGLPVLLGEAPPMRRLLSMMAKVAPSDAGVLITGEHGSGKEVLARHLHAASARATGPFVTVNAGGIAEGVFESELFGHVKGAFTDAKSDRTGYFEMADRGTLFLDEIGNLSLKLQATLLRVLQTGEFQPVGSSRTRRANVRLVSATNADLSDLAARGLFREDLLYRINTVELHLPSLRERREDIPLLAEHFLRDYTGRYGKALKGFAPDAMRLLLDYRWPGNVRELAHTLERAVLLSSGERIQPQDLNLRQSGPTAALPGLDEMPLEDVERHLIRKALERHNGNVTEAADALGLSRSALYRRVQKYGL